MKPMSRPFARLSDTALVLLLLALIAVLTAGLLLLSIGLVFEFSGPMAPGVAAGDVPLGGLHLEAAEQAVDQGWNSGRALLLSDGQRTASLTPLDLGLWVDPQATAWRAYQVGRGQNRWPERLRAYLQPNQATIVMPVVVFSPERAREGLQAAASQFGYAPVDASVAFEDGHWRAVPGQNGAALDIEATLEKLQADPLAALLSGRLEVVLTPVAPRVSDVSSLIERLEAQTSQPLRVHAYDPISDETLEWVLTAEDYGPWIRVQGETDLALDPAGLRAYLDELQPSLSGGRSFDRVLDEEDLTARWQSGQPVRVILRRPPTTYTIQPGDTLLRIAWETGIPYWKILQANPGLNPDALTVGQALTIPSQSDMLPLDVAWGKRIVISISAQRMWVYEDGRQIAEHVISTGMDRSPTQPGVFQVQTHEVSAYASVWDLTMPHFMGIYEAWPGFMNGIHGLPTLSNGRQLWGSVLGRPASYGCIILPLDAAEQLFYWAEEGTVVEITR
ncbi:MAG TPA: L,D-transpeptidase family protein [Chloroflexi bacterium]|nr:L,D-transpeptidase family protein [Chloroflexota bacterium]